MPHPIALAPGLDPSDYTSLESFAAHVQELILHLRDEGHVLSSVDQHFIERWWAAGYPLEVVLASVLEGGRKLMARKNKPRGLPLKSLHKRVEKAGGQALERGVGLGEAAQSPRPSDSLAERLLRQLEAAIETEPTPARAAAVEALGHLVESPDGAPTFTACLAVSRAYYDALLFALSPDEAERLRRQSIETLGDAAKRMTPEGLGETVEELARRSLRQQDSLLDPTGWGASL